MALTATERTVKYRKAHPEYCTASNERWRIRAKKDPRWAKNRSLKANFGITIERWEEIQTEQQHKCPCGKLFGQERTDRPNVDHDHTCQCGAGSGASARPGRACGKCVRGVLCQRCNLVLGLLEEDARLLPAYLIEYLSNHRKRICSV